MYKGKSILAIIPARGGSKELPRKNIAPFMGKPLISRTIEQAMAVNYIDKVVVSTDDVEIATISKSYGAEVPFYRPDDLSDDKSKTIDAVLHAVNVFDTHKEFYELIILLQVTSPLRNSDDIKKSIEFFVDDTHAKSLVSITKVTQNPAWMKVISKQNYLENYFVDEFPSKRRQDLPVLYIPNGAVYIAEKENLLKEKDFYIKPVSYYLMDALRSIDIDTEIDLRIAESINLVMNE